MERIPAELITFFLSMVPFLEMKISIPIGLKLGLSQTSTFIFAVSGNILPAALVLLIMDPLTKWARKHSKFLDNYLEKLFHKTRSKHSKNFMKFGALFIILFVAIPLPGSGSAMGSVIAFLFDVDYWKAITLIICGVLIAAFLITAGVTSLFALT